MPDENPAPSELEPGAAGSVDQDVGRRRLVEIRCGFAELSQREAESAESRAAEAGRLADAQIDLLNGVQNRVDPALDRTSKESAHRAFKEAVRHARDRLAVETAALIWLTEINRINSRMRETQTRLRRERETAESLLAERDRLVAAAEAARTMAEAAREACLAARRGLTTPGPDAEPQAGEGSALAADAPAMVAGAPPPATPVPPGAAVAGAAVAGAASTEPEAQAPAGDGLYLDLRMTPPQLVVRLLNREIWTLNWLVDQLAGGSLNARSAWKMRLSNFVDATIAAAIDDVFFDFPAGHPFWGMFTSEQAREVARGLAALGYRYGGFGEFIDGRVPDQRDLALAIGSAGLYPVRIRYWPRTGEYAALYREVRVSAAAFLALKAPSLTLGQLLVALGRRAEQLADLWNDWPHARPLLLSNPIS